MSPDTFPYILLAFLIGIAAGYLLLYFKYRSRNAAIITANQREQELIALLQSERERNAALEAENRRIPSLDEQRASLMDDLLAAQNKLGELMATANEVENLRLVRDAADKELRKRDGEIAELREQKKAMEAWYEKAKADFTGMFAELSQNALRENRGSFLDLARESLGKFQETAKTDLENRQHAIIDHLTPIKDRLDEVGRLNQDLKGQIGQLNETTRFVGTEASQLLRALRQPIGSGHFGQRLLEQILELAGMEEGIHFEKEVATEPNKPHPDRADFVVKLSDGQRIVVDAKAPISNHLDFVQAQDEATREEKLKKLSQSLRDYSKTLQGKEYWKYFQPSAGIMIMFVAPESALMAAMQYDGSLWDDCIRKRILLSSPTMLVGMLLTVGFGWRQAKFAKNAENIQHVGQELYDRLLDFITNFYDVGKSIKNAHSTWNKALGTLDARLLPKAREMKEMGISIGNRDVPDFPTLSLEDKSVRSKELNSHVLIENNTEKLPLAAGSDGQLLE